MVCYCCGEPGHKKDKSFSFVVLPTHWEERITCFKYNDTGHMARDWPQNDENRNCNEKENGADINGLFMVTVFCEPCDELIYKTTKEK